MEGTKTMTYNWPYGVGCGLIFGGSCWIIFHDKPFWALAMLAVGLGVGALWPKRQPGEAK